MRNPLKIYSMLVFTAVLFGCSQFENRDQNATYLARVGSSYLTVEDAKKHISAFAFNKDSTQALVDYREQWIRQQLLLREADNLDLEEQEKVREQLEKARQDILINALQKTISKDYKDKASVSDAEAIHYYRQNKNKLQLNERYVRFRHVESKSLSSARKAQNFLERDSTWTKVAENYSLNADENIRQSQQYWPASGVFENLPQMRRYVATLDSGQISPIQRHEGVYHFVQITDVREQGETAEPAWFLDELKEWMMREKQRKYYNSYVKNLYFSAREDNEIELFNVSTLNINDKPDSINATTANE